MSRPATVDENAGLYDPLAGLALRIAQDLPPLLLQQGARVEPEWLRMQLDSTAEGRADFSVALHRPARAHHLDPTSLAREVAAGFTLSPGFVSASAENGFLNFHADPLEIATRTLGSVQALGEQYGRSARPGPPVCVEHTSANPTGPFHIGRVRNGLIGDSLARTLATAGSRVTTQYYVDDVGRQAAMITWIWTKPLDSWPAPIRATLPEDGARPETEKPDQWWGRPYPAVSEWIKAHPEAATEVMQLSRSLEAGTLPPGHHRLMEEILSGMLASLGRIGVRFDEMVWESSFIEDGSVAAAVARLRAAPHAVTEPNGAQAIDASGYGLPKESARIIVARADGTTLYHTRDVAYHLKKFERFPRVIDILGQDHHLHTRTLDALLTEIGESRRAEYLVYQDVTVPQGGRMSTRKGTAVALDELLDEAVARARKEVLARREDLSDAEVGSIAESVAVGAVRYHILRVAAEKSVAFRWEDALSFEGRSGPFLQYAYARASSILRKAEAGPAPLSFDARQFREASESLLLRRIARLPSIVGYVARTGHIHTLAQHAHDTAEQFNRFYQSVPVLSSAQERQSRIALVAAFRQTLGNMLAMLGVERLERM
jgi:arginyl-tRNA synthetase